MCGQMQAMLPSGSPIANVGLRSAVESRAVWRIQ